MKIRRFVKKRRRRFDQAIVNGLNGAHVTAAERQTVFDQVIEHAQRTVLAEALKK